MTPDPRLASLLQAAEILIANLDNADRDRSRSLTARLHASVVRPLRLVAWRDAGDDLVGDDRAPDAPPGSQPIEPAVRASTRPDDEQLWELARAATELRCQHSDVAELAEASAALQDIAIAWLTSPALLSGLAAQIQAGPQRTPPGDECPQRL